MEISRISPASQLNFLPGNLPKGTEDFYNSKIFAANLASTLSNAIQEDMQAFERGSQALKEANSGQT